LAPSSGFSGFINWNLLATLNNLPAAKKRERKKRRRKKRKKQRRDTLNSGLLPACVRPRSEHLYDWRLSLQGRTGGCLDWDCACPQHSVSSLCAVSPLELEVDGDRGEHRLMESCRRGVLSGIASSKPAETGESGLLAAYKQEC